MHDISMPQTGVLSAGGRLLHWLKQPGDRIEPGDPVVEIETEKTNVELTSRTAGWLGPHLFGEGELVPAHTPLAHILDAAAADATLPRGESDAMTESPASPGNGPTDMSESREPAVEPESELLGPPNELQPVFDWSAPTPLEEGAAPVESGTEHHGWSAGAMPTGLATLEDDDWQAIIVRESVTERSDRPETPWPAIVHDETIGTVPSPHPLEPDVPPELKSEWLGTLLLLRELDHAIEAATARGGASVALRRAGWRGGLAVAALAARASRDVVFVPGCSPHYLLAAGLPADDALRPAPPLGLQVRPAPELGIHHGDGLLAAGMGLAIRLRRDDRAALVFIPEEEIDTPSTWEAMRISERWRLPVVFLLEVGMAADAVDTTLPVRIIDGAGLAAVYNAASTGLQSARKGNGPSVLQAILTDDPLDRRAHTTPDVSDQDIETVRERARAALTRITAWL